MKTRGLIFGILAATAYGLMPLFTLPLYAKGMSIDTILFYRFTLGSFALAIWMWVRHESFTLDLRDLILIAFLSQFYLLAAVCVYAGYLFLPGGVVTTIHFLYPVPVAVIMLLFFHEKASITIVLAIILAICGVGMLSWSDGNSVNPAGLCIVLISAVLLAIFLVGINWLGPRRGLSGNRVSLYILLSSALPALIAALVRHDFSFFPDREAALIMCCLAFVTGAFAMLALNYSIRTVGPTITSIIGAMEPLTAVCIGVCIFQEPLTMNLVLGIALILAAVGGVVLVPKI